MGVDCVVLEYVFRGKKLRVTGWNAYEISRARRCFDFTFIYPLNARVVEAPQVISQPVPSIFLCSPLLSGFGELQACPFPDAVFPLPFLSALSSSPFHCTLQDGFGQTW